VTRPEASAALISLGASTPGLAGCHLTEAGHAIASGSPEVRANVVRAIERVATRSREERSTAAGSYARAAQIVAEVGL
jgi:hypothetical protein